MEAAQAEMNAPRRVVFIRSLGQSGSTLLTLMLDSHPLVLGLGELRRIHEAEAGNICGICRGACAFWDQTVSLPFMRRIASKAAGTTLPRRMLGRLRRTLPARLDRYLPQLSYHGGIYDHLFERSDYPILVDSTKHPDWASAQLSCGSQWEDATPMIVFLTRDGRAVVNSNRRAHPEMTIEELTGDWMKKFADLCAFYESYQGAKFHITYEDLATKPSTAVEELCAFLGVSFWPPMIEYWNHEHHILGGSAGARSLIRHVGSDGVAASVVEPRTWHGDYYASHDQAILLDERWRTELSQRDLEYFEKTAGEMNRTFQYGKAP